LENGSGAKVTDRSHQRTFPDRGVDGDDMRTYLSPGGDGRCAPEHRERMNRRVGLEADVRFDPGTRGVDDGHPREHVRLVDPVAQHGACDRQLDPRVDPEPGKRVWTDP